MKGIELSSTFPFGILRKTVRFAQPATVLVLPRMHRLKPDLLRRLAATAEGTSAPHGARGGDDEFYGLRAYREGDRPNSIDWKRTARTGHVVVRELTRAQPPGLAVRLELSPPGGAAPDTPEDRYLLEERAVSLAASLVRDAHRTGMKISLHVPGHPPPLVINPGHRTPLAAMFEALARVDTRHSSHPATPPRPRPAEAGVVVWTGPSSPPPPRRGGRSKSTTRLGAADFARHLAATSAHDAQVAAKDKATT